MAIPLLLWGIGAAAAALGTAAAVSAAKDKKREKEDERARERERERREREAREQRRRDEQAAIIKYFHSGLATLHETHGHKVPSLQVQISFDQLRTMLKEMQHRPQPSAWMLHELTPQLAEEAGAAARRDIARLRDEGAALRQAREAIAAIDPGSLPR